MTVQDIPLSDIIVNARERQDYKDMELLIDSIATQGLIQPLVVTRLADGSLHLVAGGRRYRAVQTLEWETVPCVIREEMTPDERLEVELLENLAREDMAWQEYARGIARLCSMKRAGGETRVLQMVGKLLGTSDGHVSYAVKVAGMLDDPEISSAQNLWQAYQIILGREKRRVEEFRMAHAAKMRERTVAQLTSQVEVIPTAVAQIVASSDRHPEPPRPERAYADSHVFHGDCIKIMEQLNRASFDCIVTDFPYGIDMDNVKSDTLPMTEAEHSRDENIELFGPALDACYRVLKDNSYMAFFCDMEHWTTLLELSSSVGFIPQRWPITWVKTSSCANNAAAVNFTKSAEVAMILRKGSARLNETRSVSHWTGGLSNEERQQFQHPFSKPAGLIEWLVTALAPRGATVLDPFCGCGSVLCALHNSGYIPIGIDIVESHVLAATQHLQNAFDNPKQRVFL